MMKDGTVVVLYPPHEERITKGTHGFKRTPQSIFFSNKQKTQANQPSTKNPVVKTCSHFLFYEHLDVPSMLKKICKDKDFHGM